MMLLLAALVAVTSVWEHASQNRAEPAWAHRTLCAPLATTDGALPPGVTVTYDRKAAGRAQIALRPETWNTTVRASRRDLIAASCKPKAHPPPVRSCRVARITTWTDPTDRIQIELPAGAVVDQSDQHAGQAHVWLPGPARLPGRQKRVLWGSVRGQDLDCAAQRYPHPPQIAKGVTVEICEPLYGIDDRSDNLTVASITGSTVRVDRVESFTNGIRLATVTEPPGKRGRPHADQRPLWVEASALEHANQACPGA